MAFLLVVAVEVARLVAVGVDGVMTTATTTVEGLDNNQQNLWVTKWAMVRSTRAIVTNAIAVIAVGLTVAATTITPCHCLQCSHCSICSHRPHLFDTIKWQWRGQWQ